MIYVGLLTEEQYFTLKVMDYIDKPAKGTEVFEKDGGYRESDGSIIEVVTDEYNRYGKITNPPSRVSMSSLFPCRTDYGARQTLVFSSIDEIRKNGFSVQEVENGIWRIEGRYVPQKTIIERQKELEQKYLTGELKLSKKDKYPKFKYRKIADNDVGRLEEVEYLDEYVDSNGNRYVVRQDKEGKNIDFELCLPMVAFAEQIGENKFIAVYEKAYFGGIPFGNNFIYNLSADSFGEGLTSSNTMKGLIFNGPLRKFIDLTIPENVTDVEMFLKLRRRSEELDSERRILMDKYRAIAKENEEVRKQIEDLGGNTR